MTKLWSYEVCVKIGELQQRCDVVESAETEHPNVATLPNDVATFGVSFGFELIIEGFKPQTRKTEGRKDL